MIERSHGKARTVMPRSSDLREVETDATPSAGRDTGGRFAAGNTVATGSRWKATIRRIIGKGATAESAASVSREAYRLYCALLRELPSDGPSVRMLAALQARHAALAAYFTDRAAELGLDTEAGEAALEQSTKQGQRAERLAVTCIDVSTRLKTARPRVRRPAVDIEAMVAAASARALAAESPATRAELEADDDEDEEPPR